MGLIDELNERKKKNQTSSNSTTKKGLIEELNERKKYQSIDTTGVDQKYIDSFMADVNSFLTTADKDYGGLGWGNAASAYESRNTSWQDLNTRADALGAWLYQNRDRLSGDAYSSMNSALDSFRSDGAAVIDAFKSASDYYSQWKTEDEYNTWYQDYQKKQEMASSEQGKQGWEKYLADQVTNDGNGKSSVWQDAVIRGFTTANDNPVNMAFNNVVYDYRNDDSYKRPNDDWSEEQKNIFGYLYMTSPVEAFKYAMETNSNNNRAKEQESIKKITDSATSGFWAGAGHTIGSIATAPLGLADYINNLAMISAGRPVTSDGVVSPFEYSQAVTGGISQHLNEKYGTIGDKGLGDLYGLGTSIAQSLASAYTLGSAGTLVAYFGQGAASGMNDAMSRGASDWQAALYGTALGAFEGIAESIGIDNLFKLGSATTIKGFLKNILKQAGAEGLEEGLTALLSNIADNAIMQGKSNFNLMVSQLMADDMSESKAKKKAWLSLVDDVAFDTIAGAASGGISGGIHTTVQNIAENQAFKEHGQEIIDKGGTDALKQLALEMSGSQDAMDADVIGKLAGKVEKKASAKNVGKLSAQMENTLNNKTRAELRQALIARGLTEREAERAVDTIVEDGELSERQISKIDKNERVQKAIEDVLSKENLSAQEELIKLYEARTGNKSAEAAGTAVAAESGAESIPATENTPAEKEAKKGSYAVSQDGKTKVGDTEVSVKEVASVKDGNVVLRLEDGSTVNASDVEFGSEGEGILYDTVATSNMSAAAANAFINGYDGTVSADRYARGFREAYRYGEYGYPMREMSANGFSSYLTDIQKNLAYNLGKTDAKYRAEAAQAKKTQSTGAVNTEKNANKATKKGELHNTIQPKNERQKASLKTLGVLAKTLGIDIYTYESTAVNGVRQGANGWYDTKDGSIHIDIHAGADGKGTMLFTLAHELTHHIRAKLPAKFKAFADFLFEQYGEHGVSVSELIAKRMKVLEANGRLKGMTEEQAHDLAYEEIVADACESMLADGEAVAKIAELKTKDKSLWQTIKDFFANLVSRIKAAYEGLEPDSIAGREMAKMLDVAEQLSTMWTEAVVEASEVSDVVETDKDNVKHSDRDSTYMDAVNRGDMETAQRMVDEAAKEAGYAVKGYHATNADFTVFDIDKTSANNFHGKGIYFTNSIKDVENNYEYYEGPDPWQKIEARAYELVEDRYGISYDDTLTGDYEIIAKVNECFDEAIEEFNKTGRRITAFLRFKNPLILEKGMTIPKDYSGYDGIIDKQVYENIGHSGMDENTIHYVVFDPRNIKSADPVTYDDNGNVIPLSERFNAENNDIRYSDRDYSYEALTSKPDMTLAIVDGNVPNNRADVVAEAKKNATKVGKLNPKNGSVSVHVKDIDTDVVLSTNGLKHSLDRRADVNARVVMKAGEIISNSIRVNELTPQKAEAEASYVLIGAAKDGNGDLYVVRSVVNRFSNVLTSMDVLYAINAKKENQLRSTRPGFQGPVTGSVISVAHLLDFVNTYFPDILPESVLRYYGHESRPEGVVGESALFSDRDPDAISNRALLANALESATTNEDERRVLREYRSELAEADALEAELTEIRAKLKDLSFKRGPKDTEAIRKLKEDERKTINRIDIRDKKLLRLEAAKPIKDIIYREKQKAYKRAAQEGREALAMYREQSTRTQMRHKIKRVVSDLNKLLLHGTKERNVKLGLQEAVAAALDAINMDTVAADERVAKYNDLIAKATDPVVIASLTETRDRIQSQGDVLADKLEALRKAYAEIRNGEDKSKYPSYYTAEAKLIEDRIESVIKKVGNTPLRNMSYAQLEAVYDMYKIVLTTVRNANTVFKQGRVEDLQKNASAVMAELGAIPKLKEERPAIGDTARGYLWNELTPYYAFERIGSKTFTDFYWEAVRGQNTYANDVNEANDFSTEARKKHNYKSWDMDKIHEFTLGDGRVFRVSLKHMLSIYAYSKREQAAEHMRIGGFFFNDKETFRRKGKVLEMVKSNEAGYKIDDATLDAIKSALTAEQRAYVDEMQTYLTEMGEKGNEVTRVLWGIDLFKEKVYFPLKSSKDFIFQANQTAQEASLKNDGMTKETVPGASNPIVLEAFDEVWASHVNRMSQYHAFVIPIENLNKIHNYGTWANSDAASVSTMLRARYSEAVNEYITQFIQDLNGVKKSQGGVIPFLSGMFTKFKKTAVAGSLSVIVQQPTAILRAQGIIDAKYFVGMPSREKLSTKWEEVKKYAPIAIIKEIGGFDAGSGRQISEWLNADTQTGLKKAMSTVDEVAMWGAVKGDQLGWCAIWEAVKRETVHTNPSLRPGSDEFLEAAGERFTETIVKTQVYDSTLSRSGYMRSKNELTKMLTAFMGEPTLSANILLDSFLQARRGTITKSVAARRIGATYLAILAAVLAKSAIYALRDDEDDESYLEKYLQALSGSLASDINPLTMLPGVKDIISVFDGWEIERTDMALFQDLKNAIDGLGSESKSTWKKIEDFAGAFAAFFGLPVKNLMRTGRELYNGYINIVDGVTGGKIGAALVEGITGKGASKSDSIYHAIVNGDEARLDVYKSSYKTEDAYNAAVRKALRENDPRIKEAAEARYNGDLTEYTRIAREIIGEGYFSQDDVVSAINAEMNSIGKGTEETTQTEDKADKVTSIYSASDVNTAFDKGDSRTALAIIDDLINTKVANGMDEKSAKSSVKSSMTSYWKPLYKAAYKAKNTAEMARIRKILKASNLYGGSDDIYDTVKRWLND